MGYLPAHHQERNQDKDMEAKQKRGHKLAPKMVPKAEPSYTKDKGSECDMIGPLQQSPGFQYAGHCYGQNRCSPNEGG